MSDWSHEWGDTPCGRCTGTRGLHAKNCPTQEKAKSPSGNPKAVTYKATEPKTKFRKKPVIVEAVRYEYDKGLEDAFGYKPKWGDAPFVMLFDGLGHPVKPDSADGPLIPLIKTIEGYMMISPGDWIITGIEGERYPCKASIFEATYEAVG